MFARRPVGRFLVAGALAIAAAACGERVDVKEAVELVEASGGWYDAGIKDGKNKIVPSVSFRLRKKPDVDLRGVALNVVFRHPSAGSTPEEDWDEVYVQNAAFSEGNQTPVLTVMPEKGYTGDAPQTRLEIMQHSMFRDVHARIYAKHASTQWVDLGTIEIPRELILRK